MTDSDLPRVLAVDDQPELLRLIRLTLEPEPLALSEAADGHAALALALAERPAVVLLDIMLPGGMDGLEVCRRIRAEPTLSHTRVLLLTARDRPGDASAAAAAGADGLLGKPFSPLELLERIDALLIASRP